MVNATDSKSVPFGGKGSNPFHDEFKQTSAFFLILSFVHVAAAYSWVGLTGGWQKCPTDGFVFLPSNSPFKDCHCIFFGLMSSSLFRCLSKLFLLLDLLHFCEGISEVFLFVPFEPKAARSPETWQFVERDE